MKRGRVSLAHRAAAAVVVAVVMAVEEATAADAGMAGKDAAAKPNKSREKRPPRRALFFCFHEKNAPNRGPQKSVRAVRRQRKDQREDRLPQNRGNVRSAADEQQKAAENRNLRGVVASGAARAAARTGQGWIRTSEGVKPADLQSAPFGHSGTYPRLRALI